MHFLPPAVVAAAAVTKGGLTSKPNICLRCKGEEELQGSLLRRQ